MKEIHPSDYVAVICEGLSEKVIISILLEENLLKFTSDQLLNNELILNVRNAKNLQNNYLNFSFDHPVHVFSIHDSKTDLWLNNLKPVYRDKLVQAYHCVTAPEIEMLMIHALDKYDAYSKSTFKKPSLYIKQLLREKPKTKKFIRDFYSKYSLEEAIRLYHSKSQPSPKYLTLQDLLKS
ncbi:hypothetical protein [Facklamia hominis]|uniref:hypothetical protein n=1 Tax=Facklamia hominis TaxID=178214 RepID=UPI00101D7967|nr:hypothetical protein [Facklamia hominis]RYC98034.1 hypothetical protein EKN08_05255 [Facklamia hominis]